MGSLESLLPLFIRSLDQENPLMYLSTLETFHELISDASEVVAQQVTSMIPAFLRLSQYEPSMVSVCSSYSRSPWNHDIAWHLRKVIGHLASTHQI